MPNQSTSSGDTIAEAKIKLREPEVWFYFRVRQIQNKLKNGHKRVRVELEITDDKLEIVNITELNPDLVPALS